MVMAGLFLNSYLTPPLKIYILRFCDRENIVKRGGAFVCLTVVQFPHFSLNFKILVIVKGQLLNIA